MADWMFIYIFISINYKLMKFIYVYNKYKLQIKQS